MTIRATRRTTLGFGAAAAAAMLLSSCKSSDSDTSGGGSSGGSGSSVVDNAFGGQALDNGNARAGGELRFAASQPIETVDPIGFLAAGASMVGYGLYDSLMKFENSSGTIVGGIAESLETDDYETWTLKLRDGVTFTDGTPFTADAVVAHWTRFTGDTSTAYQAGSTRAQLKSFEASDDLTVAITTNGAQYDFAALLTGQAGMVPSPTAVDKEGDGFGQKPVGAGPFKISSFKPGGDVVLARNDDYFDSKLPYLDEITFVTVATSQGRVSAIQSGDLDIAVTLAASDIATAESAGLKTLTQAANGYWYLMANHSTAPFDDPSVRKAVLQAIDFDDLSSAVFDGTASQLKGWIPTGNDAYVEADNFPAYDADAAKQAIDDYKAGGGDPSFELLILESEDYQRLAAVVQQMLTDIGMTMTIKTVDQTTISSVSISGEYQGQFRFATVPITVGSDQWNRFNSKSMGNATKGGDATVDEILNEIIATQPDARTDLYAQYAEAMADWIPVVPLVEQAGVWIVSDNVGGFPGAAGEVTWEQGRGIANTWTAS